MSKSYEEIISVVRGDIDKLERAIVNDLSFPNEALEELLLAPAKRIRPALAFLFLRAKGLEVTEKHLALQTAIELAHTASLIHDDVVDMSEERRGAKSFNRRFDNKTAVLTGDFVLSVALKKIVDTPALVEKFLETFSQMVQGEINQCFNNFHIPTLDEYIQKSIQKTAGLFSLALDGLAEDFGLNFGLAFQIKNDLKDIDEDIKNGIYTAPVIFSNSENISLYGIEKTKELINHHLSIAEKNLQTLPVNEYSNAIREILELYREC